MLTYEEIKQSEAIKTYITRADESLGALGFTEHSFSHVIHVAETAGYILETLGFDGRTVELAKIASYLHDIGNLVNRRDHSQSGAVMAWSILNDMGCDPGEMATIVTAIGNHDEGTGVPVNAVAAAMILADKSDVRRSRVRNQDISTFDLHDRVNDSVKKSILKINEEKSLVKLKLTVGALCKEVARIVRCYCRVTALHFVEHLVHNLPLQNLVMLFQLICRPVPFSLIGGV